MRNCARVLSVMLVLSVALPVLAGEGRTPIYQYPTVIQTPGKYVVTREIVADGSGLPVIDVQARDVDIDLNGFTLRGDGQDFVIRASPPFSGINLTIRNGTVTEGFGGIRVEGALGESYKVVIEDVNVIDTPPWGIWISEHSDFAFRRNNIRGVDDAILVQGNPPPIYSMGTIEDNRIEECGSGIIVVYGSSVGILNNRLETLGIGPGVVCEQSEGCLIVENTIQEAAGSGILLADTSGSKIYNNVVRRANAEGIYVAGFSNDNLLLKNVVSQSGRDGMLVEGAQNYIRGNLLNDNGASGQGFGLKFGTTFVVPVANVYGENLARGNVGGPCLGPATSDWCDEGGGNSSFGDNFMPNLF